ncbi:MAG: DNA polymerase III subunit gamma/tau [Candidatus Tokpelaia sp.]|uniref:DNA polymerase III subunit gamma/tau n=1 Tax=Candidatus Tokpelaia sp. TaxID=2233777 RepID=UPI00123AE61E|nr:DNA polymerase III subunit gamma/tau [Candidatus Tokpelaia sp.]KAA6205705.1 MAG: DNA polymerase III subunit gamma/tau [Candidatus Tokpelaia sp.]KAA6207279.1 MAG: DNA polymerase III subunit gamma/tau [Candidatus Tokpelaia sp.]KAA6405200.1 DNA polymerase III subunit gamma/tau [Candidatus Tokpelaia sp.]
MDQTAPNMAYRVLARKYRPQNFSDLIGQEPMIRTLTNAFDMGRIAQAWMLTGVRGVGKTTTARILARALNYQTATIDRPTVRLEEMGEHCQAIMEGRHVDVVEMDAASHTGIDDIREIIEQVRYRPVAARYKVYIIDEVHMLSTQAFNGLLKTLEEPPPHAKFIFATTEIRKVPVTVLSRCQRFDLRRVDAALLTQHLQKIAAAEGVAAEPAALAMIARAGEGSVRDCLSILDQAIAHSGGTSAAAARITAAAVRTMLGLVSSAQIIDLFRLLMQGRAAEALAQLQHLYTYGAEPGVILRDLADFNHLITRLRFQPELAADISLAEEERKEAAQFAEKLSLRILSRNWQMLLKGMSEVEIAARPLAAAEMLLIRLCHAADLPNLDDALRLLEQSRQNGETAPVMLAVSSSSRMPETRQTAAGVTAAAKAIAAQAQADKTSPANAEAKPAKPEATAKGAAIMDKPQAAASPPAARHGAISLQKLVAMAEKQGNLPLKFHLRESIRPVGPESAAEAGQADIFRFVPMANAPKDIERQIAELLLAATGERRQVQAVASGGGATLAEEEQKHNQALIEEAKNNAEVAAVLHHFPKAELREVRLKPQNEASPKTTEKIIRQ